jgi:protein O-GlcNAc transferase
MLRCYNNLPMEISESLAAALPLHRKGNLDEAEKIYLSVLERCPNHADALHLFGIVKRQRGLLDEAIPLLEKACNLRPASGQFLIDCADCLLEKKEFERAIRYYERAMTLMPNDVSIYFNIAGCFHALGNLAYARQNLQKTLELRPDHFEALFDLAQLYRSETDYKRALTCLEKALALRPDFAAGHYCAGLVWEAIGDSERALAYFREAVRLDDGLAAAHNDLGNLLHSLGDITSAIAAYRHALIVKPDFYEAYFNLANCLRETDQLDEAMLCFKAALKVVPSSVQGLTNYGETLLATGSFREAEKSFRDAVKVSEGKCSQAFSNLLLCMNYNPDYSPRQIFEKHLEFGRVNNQLPPEPQPHKKALTTLRKLRIGYVSADFCNHPVARFLEPLLLSHDAHSFDIFCYCDVAKPDAVTARLTKAIVHWKNSCAMDDKEFEAAIRSDQIDILIDCAGHTGCNRLRLFAQKPAPLQISYLGYPTTTGLAAMDYYMTDAITDGGEDASFYTERLLRIDPCFCCYQPVPNAPDIGDLPAARNGFVTFGSLHTLSRLNDHIIELWSRIVQSVPGSRISIVRSTLQGTIRKDLEAKFSGYGVDPCRIDMINEIPAAGHLSCYRQIDISLDTFPWSGHTTACESLWMGVPVVTLHGNRHAGRMVSSVLSTIGLTDWVARSIDEYQSIAINKASSIDELISLRSHLREIMGASDLCNAGKFTRKVEALYKKIWKDYCCTIGEDG